MNAVLFNDFPVLQTGVLLVALAVTFSICWLMSATPF